MDIDKELDRLEKMLGETNWPLTIIAHQWVIASLFLEGRNSNLALGAGVVFLVISMAGLALQRKAQQLRRK